MNKLKSATNVWRYLLGEILDGDVVRPRGLETRELMHKTIVVPLARPVIYDAARKLSYRFMAAEALWILNGDYRVETIAPYNPNIAQFSDDGVTFFGAYGPRVISQLDHVVGALVADRDTRQAVISIWRPNPPKTKDVPCTVALAFNVRESALNVHAFMRSSDAWLGVPYDVFNFAMIGARVACAMNYESATPRLTLGRLYLTAVSSHLYAERFDDAERCAIATDTLIDEDEELARSALLQRLVYDGRWDVIENDIRCCRDREDQIQWKIRP